MDRNGGGEPVPGRQRERWERGKACNTCNRVMRYVILCSVMCVLCMVVCVYDTLMCNK